MSPEPHDTPTNRSASCTGTAPEVHGVSERVQRALGQLIAVGGLVLHWSPKGIGTERNTASLETVDWTDSCRTILKLRPIEALEPKAILRRLHQGTRRQLFRCLQRSLRTGEDFHHSVELLVPGQDSTRLDVSGTVEARHDGGAIMTLVLQDASESRARETSLRHELMQRDQMAEMAGIGAWTVDLVTNELTWSEEVFHIHEMAPGRMPTVAEAVAFYTPEAAARVEEGLRLLIDEGVRYDLILPLTTARGNHRWVQAIGDVERAPDGQPKKLVGTFRDITKEREAEIKIRAREERYVFALEGAEDGLWDWHLGTDRMYFSARWKQQIGYEDHELANDFAEWAKRVPDADREAALVAVNACLSGDAPSYRAEFQMRHKDGTWRWILARGQVVSRDCDGKPLRMVGTHTDITEQVAMRKALVAAKESAEQAAVAKSEFLATMSHEIRTPLNGILGLAQILLETELDEQQTEYLQIIFGSGTGLLEILNDILDLSRTESGKIDLESVPFDPLECAQSTVALLSQKAARKPEFELTVKADDSVPARILGDAGRLRQVLLNLVGNAVKFTEKGSVTVSLSTLGEAGGPQDLIISVRDTGIGITQDDAERLFEAFTQADSTTTRRFGGTGLGLSISRNLVHLMGGVIGCRPHQRGGSVFWVEIPIRVPDERSLPAAIEMDRAATAGPGVTPQNGTAIQALVVEDNPINQVVARKMLEKLGCTVSTVANGQEAVDATAAGAYDIVFMDCQMPVMDGYEATRLIRARERSAKDQHIPIVAMTANAMKSDPETCRAAGMDDYVSKPVLADVLKAALERGLQERRAA